MRIRPEVARAIVFFESCQPETRPFLGQVNFDNEKPFIVPEGNVVTRPVFLDQFAFEQNRFRIAAHGMRVEIPDGIKHGPCFQIGLCNFRGNKVRADAFAQISRFTDINHAIKAVAHQVDTGFVRHFVHFFL